MSNDSLTHLPGQTWRTAYTSPVVRYRDLYLTVDLWASSINLTNGSGIPWEPLASPVTLPIESNVSMDYMLFNLTDWITLARVGGDLPKYARVTQGYGTKMRSGDRVQLSLSFLIVVIVCNAVKLAVMLWVLYMEKSDFIVTIGDAAATFLEYNDPNTEQFCAFNKDVITAEVAHRNARLEAERHASASVELTPLNISNPDVLHTRNDSSGSGKAKHDAFEKLVFDSGGVWRELRYPYSSALGKDRSAGTSFMYVQWMYVFQILTGTDFLLCLWLSFYALSVFWEWDKEP